MSSHLTIEPAAPTRLGLRLASIGTLAEAVNDRGESLCGEAPPQALHVSECHPEQLRGVEGGELPGKEAGQDFGAALLSRAQS